MGILILNFITNSNIFTNPISNIFPQPQKISSLPMFSAQEMGDPIVKQNVTQNIIDDYAIFKAQEKEVIGDSINGVKYKYAKEEDIIIYTKVRSDSYCPANFTEGVRHCEIPFELINKGSPKSQLNNFDIELKGLENYNINYYYSTDKQVVYEVVDNSTWNCSGVIKKYEEDNCTRLTEQYIKVEKNEFNNYKPLDFSKFKNIDLTKTISILAVFDMPVNDVARYDIIVSGKIDSAKSETIINLDPSIGIENCTDLQDMNNDLTGDYYLTQDIDCSDTVNWNSGDGFNPIGTGDYFKGTFDGRNHTISDLFINRTSTSYIGLFSQTSWIYVSEVKNVGLINVNIIGNAQTGALVGRVYGYKGNTTIENCYATGNLTGGANEVGGLFGVVYSGGTPMGNSYINGCYSNVDVTHVATGGSPLFIGGFTGSISGAQNWINDSYATGSVTASNRLYVAGFVGLNADGQITNCYATGNVTASNYAGGFVGSNQGGGSPTIINSYSTGSVTASSTVYGFYDSNTGTLTNCWCYNQSGDTATHCGTGVSGFDSLSDAYDITHNVYDSNSPTWDFTNIWSGINNGTDYPILGFWLEKIKPIVTLNSPDNDYNSSTNSITFNCTASDNVKIDNVTLYGNWTGSWSVNETNSSGLNGTEYIFTKTIPSEGTYEWNCYACDNLSNCAFADSNRTFNYEIPEVGISVLYPDDLVTTFNATQNEFFNVTLNISCDKGECGTINVSLDPEPKSQEKSSTIIANLPRWTITKTGDEKDLNITTNEINDTRTEFCVSMDDKTSYNSKKQLKGKDIASVPITKIDGSLSLGKQVLNLDVLSSKEQSCFFVDYGVKIENRSFKIGWESVVVYYNSDEFTLTDPSYIDNICKSPNGQLHVAFEGYSDDVWYANSSDNGLTWSSRNIYITEGAGASSVGILCNSTNGVLVYADILDDIIGIDSPNSGETFTNNFTMADIGYLYDPSCFLDSQDKVHCVVMESGGDQAFYVNSSNWDNEVVVNTNDTDDSDICNIAVYNQCPYVVCAGDDDEDLDIWSPCLNGWGSGNRTELDSGLSMVGAGYGIDMVVSGQDFYIAYIENNDLQFCNSSFSHNLSSFDCKELDSDGSYHPSIFANDQGGIEILYIYGSDDGYMYRSNSSNYGLDWSVREQWTDSNNDANPSLIGSLYPSSNNGKADVYYVYTDYNDLCFGNYTIDYIDYKSGLISTNESATPFYTNASTNPLKTNSLSEGDSEVITFWVNATGETGVTHTFYAYANLTSNLSISNITSEWDVQIIEAISDTINPDVNITYPLNTTYYNQDITELNYTYSDENPGDCWYSNDSGVNNYSIQTAGLNFTSVTSVIGSNDWTVYCNDSFGNENSSSISFNRLQTSISSVHYDDPVTLTGGTTKNVYIYFNISDINFNSSSGQINISNSGESRYNLTCINTTIQFNCTLVMYYYDSPGTWTINTSVKNNNQEWIYNDTETFTVNDLDYVTQDVKSISWSTLNVGIDDNEADNTITLTNGGNQDYPYINVTGYDSDGDSNGNLIFAENFSISNLTGESENQVYMINNTEVDSSSHLNLNSHGTDVTEEIFFYVDLDTGLLADTYRSTNDWSIKVS